MSKSNLRSFTMHLVRTWDAIIIGGGIIGLSLARELHKRGLRVLIVERGEPGREASHAAAGMLADGAEIPPALREIAAASARMYPEFVLEVRDESGVNPDLRDQGTIWTPGPTAHEIGQELSPASLAELEPALKSQKHPAYFLRERSVDPRALTDALCKAAKHREIDISSGAEVLEVISASDRVIGVRTSRTSYNAPIVVNCAGAWAGAIPPYQFPVRPVKGHMLSVVGPPILRHVIRTADVYLVPRTDGRIVIGSTLEEAGFDKRVGLETIQRLHRAALALVPQLHNARIHEEWTGLRPGTPDDLPILGETKLGGYFVATGHFRDGILLAPITARLMLQLISGATPAFSINAFSPHR